MIQTNMAAMGKRKLKFTDKLAKIYFHEIHGLKKNHEL